MCHNVILHAHCLSCYTVQQACLYILTIDTAQFKKKALVLRLRASFFLTVYYRTTIRKHDSCAAYEETHFIWSMLEISKTDYKKHKIIITTSFSCTHVAIDTTIWRSLYDLSVSNNNYVEKWWNTFWGCMNGRRQRWKFKLLLFWLGAAPTVH